MARNNCSRLRNALCFEAYPLSRISVFIGINKANVSAPKGLVLSQQDPALSAVCVGAVRAVRAGRVRPARARARCVGARLPTPCVCMPVCVCARVRVRVRERECVCMRACVQRACALSCSQSRLGSRIWSRIESRPGHGTNYGSGDESRGTGSRLPRLTRHGSQSLITAGRAHRSHPGPAPDWAEP